MLSKSYIKNIKRITKNTINLALFGFINLTAFNTAFANVNVENKLIISNNKDIKTVYKREGSISFPIIYDDKSLFFLNMGGNFDNQRSYGMNIGLGARRDFGKSEILGLYGFYDYLSSSRQNNFHQVSSGIEMLSRNWETRLNMYIPVGKVEHGNNLEQFVSESDLKVSSDALGNMFLSGTFLSEAALKGFDGEFGRKVKNKLGVYLGGYYFYRDNYENIVGPKMRLTWSEVINKKIVVDILATVQNDNVKGTQLGVGLNLKMPIGKESYNNSYNNSYNDLLYSKIQKGMEIVTSVSDYGVNPPVGALLNGRTYYKYKVLTADPNKSLVDEINEIDGNELIILDGKEGDFNVSNTIKMKSGQALLGGEGSEELYFTVAGMTFNNKLPYSATAAKIVSADDFPGNTNLLELAVGNMVKGIEFDGATLSSSNPSGRGVIYGINVSGVKIESNTINTFEEGGSNPNFVGIKLENTSNAVILDNNINVSGVSACGIHFGAGEDKRISLNNIKNNRINAPGGIGINHSITKAIGNNINDNDITSDVGIRYKVTGDSSNVGSIMKNNITNNVIKSTGNGIYYEADYSQIRENLIDSNDLSSIGGNVLQYKLNNSISNYNVITKNTITTNGDCDNCDGLSYDGTQAWNAEDNIISYNRINVGGLASEGIVLWGQNSVIKRNTIENNFVTSNGGHSIGLSSQSQIEGNIISSNVITVSNDRNDNKIYGIVLSDSGLKQHNKITNNNIIVNHNNGSIGISSEGQDTLIANNKITLNSLEASAVSFLGNENTVNLDSTGNSYIVPEDYSISENFCEGTTSDGSKVTFTDGLTCPGDAKS